MRKIMTLLLAMLLVSVLCLPVAAQQTTAFTLEPSAHSAAPGEEIQITVSVESAQTCTSLGYIPEYDMNVLEIVGGKCVVANAALAEFSAKEGGVLLCQEETVPQGAVFQFTVRVKDDAPEGVVTIGGMVAVNRSGENITASITECELKIAHSGGSVGGGDISDIPLDDPVPDDPQTDTKPQNPEPVQPEQFVEPEQSGESGQSNADKKPDVWVLILGIVAGILVVGAVAGIVIVRQGERK